MSRLVRHVSGLNAWCSSRGAIAGPFVPRYTVIFLPMPVPTSGQENCNGRSPLSQPDVRADMMRGVTVSREARFVLRVVS